MELPQLFVEKMKSLLGEEYSDYEACLQRPKQSGIRVNTSKISVEEFRKIAPFEIEPVPWTENGFFVEAKDQPAKHPFYHAGLYYIQEPSAMAPAAFLPVEPGDKVLDLCAAPGGKSTELGARLKGEGLLVSNDISITRTKVRYQQQRDRKRGTKESCAGML
jgi:16S rRNA C967 or C1407 C5-methylase (RsmB/RsmF family)